MSKILGVSERYYPCEIDPIGPPVTLAILVEDEIGDYACYVGHGSAEWVKRFGDKISFQEASGHFPGQLKEELYRL